MKELITEEEIVEAFENLRHFESTNEVEWERVQVEADRAILALKKGTQRHKEAMKQRAIEFAAEIASLSGVVDEEFDKEIERRYNEKYGSDEGTCPIIHHCN